MRKKQVVCPRARQGWIGSGRKPEVSLGEGKGALVMDGVYCMT